MIVLFIHSGIGNQFFQYAFAKQLAIKYNEKIYISMYNMKKTKDRQYILSEMVAGDGIVVLGTYASLMIKIVYYIKRKIIEILTHGIDLDNTLSKFGIYNHQSPYDYVSLPSTKAKVKFIFSNYQNKKYWKDNEEEILKTLIPNTEYCFDDIPLNNNCVCVHIRRGDYVHNERWRKELYVCDNEYYSKAMIEISKKIENPKFYIFSNSLEDIEEIKREMKFDFPVEYVNPEKKDYLDLFKMSKFNNYIISNSTFSWWAQEISTGDGYVVVPSIWNRTFRVDDFKNKELYKKKLIVIEV